MMKLGLEGAPVGGEGGAQFLENVIIQQAPPRFTASVMPRM
jgi:hypothetical protein